MLPVASSLPFSSHFPDLFVGEISSSPDSQVIVPLMGPHRSLPCGGKYEVGGGQSTDVPSSLKGKMESSCSGVPERGVPGSVTVSSIAL